MNGTTWIWDVEDKSKATLNAINSHLDAVDGKAQKTGDSLAHVSGGALEVAAGFGLWTTAQAIVEGVTDAVKETWNEIKETTKAAERFNVLFENSFQSEKVGEQMQAMLTGVQDKVGVLHDTLLQTFIKLRAQVFTPTQKQLIEIGDIAASTAIPFDELAATVQSASMGMFRGLKQIGVQMEAMPKDANKLEAIWHGHKTVIDNNADSIRKYVLHLGDMVGIQGAAAKLMDTIGGKEIIAANASTKLYEKLGVMFKPAIIGGIDFKLKVIDKISGWIDYLDKHSADIKEFFNDIYEGGKIAAVGITAASIAWAIFNAEMIASQLVAGGALLLIKGLDLAIWGVAKAQWAWNAAVNANPYVILAEVIGLVIAEAYWMYERFSAFRELFFGIGEVAKQVFTNVADLFKNIFGPIFETIQHVLDGKFAAAAASAGHALFNLSGAGASVEIAKWSAQGGPGKGVDDAWDRGTHKGAMSFAQDEYERADRKKKGKQNLEDKLLDVADGKGGSIEQMAGLPAGGADASAGATAGGAGTVTGGGGARNITVHNTFNMGGVHGANLEQSMDKVVQYVEARLIAGMRDVEVIISAGS